MKKKCELCNRVATSYCESDEASLCWPCDFNVHSANFLVAKHSRVLLCRICQGPTPFSGSGVHLDTSPRTCSNCTPDDDVTSSCPDEDDDVSDSDDDDDDSGSDDDDDDDQVVPSPTCIRRPTPFNKS